MERFAYTNIRIKTLTYKRISKKNEKYLLLICLFYNIIYNNIKQLFLIRLTICNYCKRNLLRFTTVLPRLFLINKNCANPLFCGLLRYKNHKIAT